MREALETKASTEFTSLKTSTVKVAGFPMAEKLSCDAFYTTLSHTLDNDKDPPPSPAPSLLAKRSRAPTEGSTLSLSAQKAPALVVTEQRPFQVAFLSWVYELLEVGRDPSPLSLPLLEEEEELRMLEAPTNAHWAVVQT